MARRGLIGTGLDGITLPEISMEGRENMHITVAASATPIQAEEPPTTPSPTSVGAFESTAVTSANRSTVVSRLIDYQVKSEDAGELLPSSNCPCPNVALLPELDDEINEDVICRVPTVAIENDMMSSATISSSTLTPPSHVRHKMLLQSVSSIASVDCINYGGKEERDMEERYKLFVGPEREVYFHEESLGLKISRHTDGYVRVLSVTPYRPMGDGKVCAGDIYEGDVVREVTSVDLRKPIDAVVWKLTIGLIRLAPRPLKMIVATELEDENEMNRMLGMTRETRTITFHERALGVRLHHNSLGTVQILSVSTCKPGTKTPIGRSGVIRNGDIVLEVGGVWDLRLPIHVSSWGVLIRYLRETERPLSMVVASQDDLSILGEHTREK